MALSRSRRSSGSHELFWPGYVDVLSTLLLVFTFLLSVFMVAQFYVSQESTGKDSVLRRLQRQIAELTNLLSLEKGQGKKTQDELLALQAMLATLRADNERLTGVAGLSGEKDARIAALTKELSDKSLLTSEAQAKIDLLNQQLLQLRRQMAALQEAINAYEAKDKDSQVRIADLGARLNTLLAHGLVERLKYQDHPERFEYHLTQQGRDLFPVIVALMSWGDDWASPDGPPTVLRHGCGGQATVEVVCSECGERLGLGDVRLKAGPGWRPMSLQ